MLEISDTLFPELRCLIAGLNLISTKRYKILRDCQSVLYPIRLLLYDRAASATRDNNASLLFQILLVVSAEMAVLSTKRSEDK